MGGQNIVITFDHYYKVCVKKKLFVSHDSYENVAIDCNTNEAFLTISTDFSVHGYRKRIFS